MKYEIEAKCFPGYPLETLVGTLTGLDYEDIKPRSEKIKRWGGQTFVKLFRDLGYNVNPRFIAFDPETNYPCLMRCRSFDRKDPYWYGFGYYDNVIYDQDGDTYFTEEVFKTIRGKSYFVTKSGAKLRVTSMLQVWI